MSKYSEVPNRVGQLVWSPPDPSLGIGIVTGVEGSHVRIRFLRLQEERAYTTRGPEPVVARYLAAAGERVKLRASSTSCRVSQCLGINEQGLALYRLEDGQEILESLLEPDVRDLGPKERLGTLNLVHPEVVRARIAGLRLANFGQRRGHAAILGARVQWLAHQVDVATRGLESEPVRLLLADEVGLGKTVEAALIYAGLRYEGRVSRVLILTPEALCIQWLGEIYRKAHELLVLLDGQRLEDAARDFPQLSPFEAHQRMVMSLERLSSDAALATAALNATWDLVIVDEAHHLRWAAGGASNAAYRLVEGLAAKTRHLLLLTATPMALDPAEYHALLRLLDPARFDDPTAFDKVAQRVANIRAVVQPLQEVVASNQPVPAELAAACREILRDDPEDTRVFASFCQLAPGDSQRPHQARYLLDAMRERHGLAAYVVRNRRGPVGGLPQRRAQVFPLEPTPAQALLLEVGESVVLGLAESIEEPKQQAKALGEALRALWATPHALGDILKPYSPELAAELAAPIAAVVGAPLDGGGLPTGDSRLRWLVEIIRSLPRHEKLLVFVESATAVQALRSALEAVLGTKLALFHRDMPPRDQDRQVAWFRSAEGPQVMLSTEAGGEGRNFQFCHRVVLYDLPWRPATVEQRIGRVDRVGQKNDVHVLVPYFAGGYEAAVVKIMQDCIGVLDRTVGGMDHGLEYVSDRIAGLIMEGAGVEGWQGLYTETARQLNEAKARIEAGVDPILDHASFSPERSQAVLSSVPEDLEARTEALVQSYAHHSKLHLHSRGQSLVAIEGAAGAAGRDDHESGFMATFSRLYALDHEDVEFLSFGHPLVNQAMEWARSGHEACAALALCRGVADEGAIFLWCYEIDVPDDVPAVANYFDTPLLVFAVDEAGRRVPALENLLTDVRRLERMDPAPLRSHIKRWQLLVDKTQRAAAAMATSAVADSMAAAQRLLTANVEKRTRLLRRAQTRELAQWQQNPPPSSVQESHAAALAQLVEEHKRLSTAIAHAEPRLFAGMAVRLLRAKQVSA